MRVELDRDRCRGHGRCYHLAARTFEGDHLGYSTIRPGSETAADDQVAEVRNAVATCPEQALRLHEL